MTVGGKGRGGGGEERGEAMEMGRLWTVMKRGQDGDGLAYAPWEEGEDGSEREGWRVAYVHSVL